MKTFKASSLLTFPILFVVFSFFFSGCQAIADIFKAGFAVGIIVVIVILAIIFGIARMFKK